MKKSPLSQPPRWIRKCLQWWSKKAEIEDLIGDLDEYFQYVLEEKGKYKAQLIYFIQALSLALSYALKKRKRSASYSYYYNSNSIAMFNNYFKIALRNFSKHKFFTTINIIGLALGMSISLLVVSISIAIYKSDDWHEKKDRIYQINTYLADDINDKTFASTFHAVGDYLQKEYPFIENTVKIKDGFDPVIKHQGMELDFQGHFTNSAFFEVFDFELISGNPKTALSKPYSIIITQTVADKLFRDSDPMGQMLETEFGSYEVTGVMADLKQTHLFFDVLGSYKTFEQMESTTPIKTDWKNYRNNYVYALLKPGTNQETLHSALNQVAEVAGEFNPELTVALESVVLSEVVPRWNISNALGIGWDQPSLIFFMSVGLLILLPAVFNYTNLSIARALKRGKEIGIRKVVGAEKRQIKAQFIIETVLLSLLSLVVSFFIYIRLQKEFFDIVASSQVLDTTIGFTLVAAFILFAIIIGLLAGLFPAAYFSRLNPIYTLKGGLLNGSSHVSQVKKGLFVFQFFLSLIFIIGVTVLSKEYVHVLNSNHGFTSEHVLTVPFYEMDKQLAINELKKHPDVLGITTSSELPGMLLPQMTEVSPNGLDTMQINEVFVGERFMETLNIEMIWGESERMDHSTQNQELVVVNETFMKSTKVFNIQNDSLQFTLADGTKCRIVGLVKDFNFERMDQLIRPLVFRKSQEASKYALLTIHSDDINSTINDLDYIWSNIDQESYFEPSFLDDKIEEAYYFLRVQIKFFTFLSAFAISISCLGLLGMISYTTENRTKEIAIRKIMGASNQNLYYLLTRDFIKLILIASIIAIPFSYFFYDRLFLYFLLPYGDGLGVLEVLFSILFLFLVGFVSIYWQTSKVAHANPAGKLRHE